MARRDRGILPLDSSTTTPFVLLDRLRRRLGGRHDGLSTLRECALEQVSRMASLDRRRVGRW